MQNLSDSALAQLRDTLTTDQAKIRAEQVSVDEQIASLRHKYAELEATIAKNNTALADLDREMSFRQGTPAQLAARSQNWEELLTDWIGIGNTQMVRTLHPKRERLLHGLRLCTSGSFAETQQRCLCLMMPAKGADAVKEMELSLEIIIPHIQPVGRWCNISILQSNAHSPEFHLRFSPDRSVYQIVNGLRDSQRALFETSSLKTILSYIQSNYSFRSNTV